MFYAWKRLSRNVSLEDTEYRTNVFFRCLHHWPLITLNGQSRFAGPLGGVHLLNISFFTPFTLSLRRAWLTLLWKLIWLVLNMSSCYSIALSFIFVLCVFREFEGQEACRILCSVSLVECFLPISPWERRWWLECDGSVFWVGMVVLIRSLPAKLIQNWMLFLVKLVKTCFGHLLVDLALVFIPGFGGLVFLFLTNMEEFDSLRFKSAWAAGNLKCVPQILRLLSFLIVPLALVFFLIRWLFVAYEWVPRHMHRRYWQGIFL